MGSGKGSEIDDSYNLARFVAAQEGVYDRVLSELRLGRKTSHWMWFIFPQLRGLGHSRMAQDFAISSREEAAAYLAHPVLGPRLVECTRLVNQINERSVEEIFGHPDDLKFRSSMTLFAALADGVFQSALEKYFEGKGDPLTIGLLG